MQLQEVPLAGRDYFRYSTASSVLLNAPIHKLAATTPTVSQAFPRKICYGIETPTMDSGRRGLLPHVQFMVSISSFNEGTKLIACEGD